jgi:hypothetical protein
MPKYERCHHFTRVTLETAVGQARVCGLLASWPGTTTLQTAFCKEKVVPQEGRRRQGAKKPCNLACSGATYPVKALTAIMLEVFMHLSTPTSSLMPFLGSAIRAPVLTRQRSHFKMKWR